MPKQPDWVKIGPHVYQIRWYDQTEEDATRKLGYCLSDTLIIGIRDNLLPSKKTQILLHEIIHALCFVYDLDRGEIKEEDVCHRLSLGLMGVFVDNPKLSSWLLSHGNTVPTK